MSTHRSPRTARKLVLICCGLAFAGVAGAADAPASRDGDATERLLAAGRDSDAEARLRAALGGGDESTRLPLAQLLLRTRRAKDAQTLLREGKPGAVSGQEARLFTEARIAEELGAHADAENAYRRSAAQEPLLADHAMFRAALAAERGGRLAESLAAFESAADAARTARLRDRSLQQAAEICLRSENATKAGELIARLASRSTIAGMDRLALEARIARAAGDTAREVLVLRELLDAHPATGAALEATERLPELAPADAEDRFRFAEIALANRHAPRAEAELAQVRRTLGDSASEAQQGRIRLLAGRAKMLRREYTAARREFEKLPKAARPADRAAAALDAARCLWRLEQIDACLEEYDRIAASSLPESTRALAAWEAAREAKDDRRWAEAARRFEAFARSFPRHDSAGEANWQRGRALAAAGDSAGALAVFEEISAAAPGTARREEARFWTARIHLDRADSARACAEMAALESESPDTYWALRARSIAAARCGRTPRTPAESDAVDWLALGERTSIPIQEAALRQSDLFQRARTLAALGLGEEAEAELAGLRRTMDSDDGALFAFAETAWSLGVPREAMRAAAALKRRRGGDVVPGTMPPSAARLLYPVAHWQHVRRWADENDLDPLFVLAVMREESWLDARAVSGAGARGLLQIMPATGYDLAERAGVHGFSADDLFRPDINVRLGARYLRELLDDYDGEPVLALAAYNAGRQNANRWRDGDSFDPDEYVAAITFQETHGYVQKVLRTWEIYRALWADALGRLDGKADAARERAANR